MAGFRHLLACEFVEEARKTYEQNFPSIPVAGDDIRALSVADVLRRTGLKAGELDVLEGSPPCSSFSTAGKRAAGWGEAKRYSTGQFQRTDDLFDEYLRLLTGLRPRAFVAENVSGMVKGAAKGFFLDVLAQMKAAGYDVRAQLLDARWLGVPQARQRVIFVGIRNGLVDAAGAPLRPTFPKPLTYSYSIREALAGVVNTPEELAAVSIERFSLGEAWEEMGGFGQSTRYRNLLRPDPDKPCPTITAVTGHHMGSASVTHPTEKRKFTVAELKRLSGVPDDFVLTGKLGQQMERLGRCVPPPLMFRVARAVKATLARAA